MAPEAIFVMVMTCVAEVRPGVPVPVNVAVSALPLDFTDKVPVTAPSTVGVKVTAIWQEAPEAILVQLIGLAAKSPVTVADVTELLKLE